MRASVIILSGLSAFAAAQSSTDLAASVSDQVTSAVASASSSLSPAELSSVDSVAYSSATAAIVSGNV